MPTYNTPGVYIEEISTIPASVAGVATAVPAFIGYTEKAFDSQGEDLANTAVRITSLLEYELKFGKPPLQDLSIDITKRVTDSAALLGVEVTWNGTAPTQPAKLMHYSMQLYFANGGGPCYIFSVGSHVDNVTLPHFEGAITALEAVDEPTLLVFPDAVGLDDIGYGQVVDAALTSCNKMQDRFTIADVRNAVDGGTVDNAAVTTNFRDRVTKNAVDFLKYGASYFPYLSTSIPFHTSDDHVTIATYTDVVVDQNGTETRTPSQDLSNKTLSETTIKVEDTAVYSAIQSFLSSAFTVAPPSGAVRRRLRAGRPHPRRLEGASQCRDQPGDRPGDPGDRRPAGRPQCRRDLGKIGERDPCLHRQGHAGLGCAHARRQRQ